MPGIFTNMQTGELSGQDAAPPEAAESAEDETPAAWVLAMGAQLRAEARARAAAEATRRDAFWAIDFTKDI